MPDGFRCLIGAALSLGLCAASAAQAQGLTYDAWNAGPVNAAPKHQPGVPMGYGNAPGVAPSAGVAAAPIGNPWRWAGGGYRPQTAPSMTQPGATYSTPNAPSSNAPFQFRPWGNVPFRQGVALTTEPAQISPNRVNPWSKPTSPTPYSGGWGQTTPYQSAPYQNNGSGWSGNGYMPGGYGQSAQPVNPWSLEGGPAGAAPARHW
ncbi:hypothetical protein [Magnetofaba australis]|uniref:hypothetical protein n=1 Tax=Magnetofaba australis TaxID=1472297 RepID=UPI000A19BD56|nr:hypothetical protein [Magnetofaba australis]